MATDEKEPLPPLHAECEDCQEITYLGDMVWRGDSLYCLDCEHRYRA